MIRQSNKSSKKVKIIVMDRLTAKKIIEISCTKLTNCSPEMYQKYSELIDSLDSKYEVLTEAALSEVNSPVLAVFSNKIDLFKKRKLRIYCSKEGFIYLKTNRKTYITSDLKDALNFIKKNLK